jgi:cold shock CspA family protein
MMMSYGLSEVVGIENDILVHLDNIWEGKFLHEEHKVKLDIIDEAKESRALAVGIIEK